MKIYTKGGDHGTTSLFGGKRVEKDNLRVEAYGNVDELNSLIGVILFDLLSLRGPHERSNLEITTSRSAGLAMTHGVEKNIKDKLIRVQTELFVLGADLSAPLDIPTKGRSAFGGKVKVPRIKKTFISRLEKEIDHWEKELPKITKFILPGGSKIGAKLHFARTVARRAERAITALAKVEKVNVNAQIYINRLSDWFFVAARYANKLQHIEEKIWQGRG